MSEGRIDHQEWDELAAGYALDALDPDEELRFAAHLDDCDRCKRSLADHELVAAGLGAIAHPAEATEPPAWERIRPSIIGTPQAPLPTLAARRGRRRYELSRRALGAAAAAVLIAAGGVTTWRITAGGSSCPVTGGCHTVHLDAGATTAALLTIRGNDLTLRTTELHRAPTGKIYVLWQQPRDARPVPVTEFTANPEQMPVMATLRAPYDETQQFAVSLENATGVAPKAPSNLLASGNAA